MPTAFVALFTFRTAHLVPTARFPRPGFCTFASLTPNRGVGGAPRNVRVLGGTPVGRTMCVKDARERAYDAIRQAPSEAPCVGGTLASRRSTVAVLGSRGRASVSFGARRPTTAGRWLADP